MSQKYIDILSKNFRKLRYFLPFPVSALFFTLFIPLSFGFANFVQSPLSTFDSHIMAFVVATVPLFFLRKEIGQDFMFEMDFQPMIKVHIALPVVQVRNLLSVQHNNLGTFIKSFVKTIFEHREKVSINYGWNYHQEPQKETVESIFVRKCNLQFIFFPVRFFWFSVPLSFSVLLNPLCILV